MSFTLLGILNAQASGGISYYFASLGGASDEGNGGIAADNLGNSYFSARTNTTGAGSYDWFLAKSDKNGAVQWQRTLGSSGFDSLDIGSLALDSSANVYVVGGDATASRYPAIAKYNSSGVIQWQQKLTGATLSDATGVATTGSYVYLCGNSNDTGYRALLAKYSDAGNLQWQRILGPAAGSSNDEFESVAIDSSGNVYAIGTTSNAGAGNRDVLLAKYNSSGTIQWQRVLGGASEEFGSKVALDSSDNVYIAGYTNSQGAGDYDLLLAKYNSSGTIQWQRVLGGTGGDAATSLVVNATGDVYLLGNAIVSSKAVLVIAKYNSSGTIQWQRQVASTTSEVSADITLDLDGTIRVIGRTSSAGEGGNDILILKLPNDGSLTGTYTLDGASFVYSASTLTSATSTLTAATSSLTARTSTLTSTTATMTDASASLVSHIVTL